MAMLHRMEELVHQNAKTISLFNYSSANLLNSGSDFRIEWTDLHSFKKLLPIGLNLTSNMLQ